MKLSAVRLGIAMLMSLPFAGSAWALDNLTIALSSGGTSWDFSVAVFGEKKGFFAEEGIHIDVANADSAAAGLQAVIAGSADLTNVGVSQFLAASMNGAPVKMISSSFTGTSDWLWYVPTASPIKSLDDVKPETTIGVNSLGSSAFIILSGLLKQHGKQADIVTSGSNAAVLAQVMTGQVEVGTDGNGLLGVPQFINGEIRPVFYGRDLDLLRAVSVRGIVARAEKLEANRDLFVRFLRAYQKTVDWMYKDPEAIAWFAAATGGSLAEANRVVTDMYPAGAMDVRDVAGLDTNVKVSLDFKRIDRPPTEAEIAKGFDSVWKPGTM